MFKTLLICLCLLTLFSIHSVQAADTQGRGQLISDCTAAENTSSLVCKLLPVQETENPNSLCVFLQRINAFDYALRENYLNARLIGRRTLAQLQLTENKINCTDKLSIEIKIDYAAEYKEQINQLLNKQQELQQLQAQTITVNSIEMEGMVKQIDTLERMQGNNLVDTTYTIILSDANPKTIEFTDMPVKYTVAEGIAYLNGYIKRARNEIMQSGLNSPQPITHYDFKQATDKYIQAEKEKSDKEILKLEQWRKKLKREDN